MRYKDLAALKAAYDSGALTHDVVLLLDKDDASAYDQRDTQIFEMHPSELLKQALDLLGIPWEYFL